MFNATFRFVVSCLDETNLPADIPSYLSSQGTLAERQDGYMASESGSSHQYISSSTAGFYMPHKDINSKTGRCSLYTHRSALLKIQNTVVVLIKLLKSVFYLYNIVTRLVIVY